MKVNRERLLAELRSVESGLSTREIIEQSSCFVFQDGLVHTYNDEVTCRRKTVLTGIEGAIRSNPLLDLLSKMPDKIVTVRVEKSKDGAVRMVVIGKRRKATLRMEAEVHLPIEHVKPPKEWNNLPKEFTEAIQMVKGCTVLNSSDFGLSCIHCAPDFVEACDRMQAARVNIKIGLERPVLVRKESISHVIPLAMQKWGLTKTWIHFKNQDGLMISCRRYDADEYRDLGHLYENLEGEEVHLSEKLLNIESRANVLSSQNPEGNHLSVNIEAGRIKISSTSIAGRYVEFAELEGYSGAQFRFYIQPDTLKYVIREHKVVLISSGRIIAQGPNFVYIASITPSKE